MSDLIEARILELSEKADRFFTLDGQPIDDHVLVPRQTIKAIAEVVRAARGVIDPRYPIHYTTRSSPNLMALYSAIYTLDSQEEKERR